MIEIMFFALGFFVGGLLLTRIYKSVEETKLIEKKLKEINDREVRYDRETKRSYIVNKKNYNTAMPSTEIKPWEIEDPKDVLEYQRRDIEEVN